MKIAILYKAKEFLNIRSFGKKRKLRQSVGR